MEKKKPWEKPDSVGGQLETEFNIDDKVTDEFWSNALKETDSSDDEFVESAECLRRSEVGQ